MNPKTRTVLLGLTFLAFLLIAYYENVSFFNMLNPIFENTFLAITMVFIHNVLAISIILLGISFYVEFVLNFLKEEKHEYVVLEHPKIFAILFTLIILFVSILRSCMLIYGVVEIQRLGLIILLSSPNGIIEAYGIYLTIKETLNRTITMKTLALIYGLFFVAALMEVGFVKLLISITQV